MSYVWASYSIGRLVIRRNPRNDVFGGSLGTFTNVGAVTAMGAESVLRTIHNGWGFGEYSDSEAPSDTVPM